MWTKIIWIFVIFLLQSRISVSNETNVRNPQPSGFGMRFRLPFTDMNIQSVSNLKIIKDVAGQQVFLLHGTELYRLVLERDRKMITLIANLEGAWQESELLGAEIISWRHLFLLVVALEDHLEVFQFANETIMRGSTNFVASEIPTMDSIQQITLHGRYRKLFLCESSDESVNLIVLVNFNKLYSRINTYEWSKTYFDPMEEKSIPPIQDIKLIGSQNKYLITSRLSRSQTKITVTTYTILPTLKQIQVMQLLSNLVHPFTYQESNYLLTCTLGHKKCTTFKMTKEQFTLYKKRPANEVSFTHFTAGEHILVGLKDEKVSVYLNTRLECYGTFRTDTKNISSILTHINNQEESHFILLNYVRDNSTLLRFVEIEFEQRPSFEVNDDVDDLGDPLKHQKHAFEESIAKLRKILLSQKYSFDEIKKTIQSESSSVAYQNPIRIYSGNIGIVKIVGSKLRSPVQIRQRLQAISSGERRTRFSRGFVDDFNKTSTLNLKVKSLQVGNLILENDLIPGFNISSDFDHLKILIPVTTKILATKELLTATVMASRSFNRFITRSIPETTMSVRNVNVKRINGVLWEDFYQNVFLKSRDRSISGRLILQSSAEIDNLEVPVLNGLPTKSLFNLVSDQNITSDIVISRFFASDLQVDLVNGLDITRDVAMKGMDNVIKSPVIAEDVSVAGELILAENDHRARHIFGTSVLDLQQTYTGKVLIEGSLTLANVFVEDQQKTRIFVGENELSADIKTNFWMKSISQEFDKPISFIDCTISAPALNTINLNNHPISDYLFTTTMQSVKPVLLIFISAHIQGSLIADKVLGTKIRHIDRTAVKITEPMVISGEKVFQGDLSFYHGEIKLLNQLAAQDIISNNRKVINFTGNKTFKSITVTEKATVTKNLNARLLNGASSSKSDLSETDNHFGTVVISSTLKVKNLLFDFLNRFSSEEIFNRIRQVDNDLILHKDIFVEGSLEFKADLHVDTVNDIDWKTYVDSLVRVNENTIITGRKTFSNELTILTELKTPTINNLLIDNLFGNILLKSQYQVISGAYTFDNLNLTNINVPDINGFSTSEFIDTRSLKVIINSDIILQKLTVRGSLFGRLDIDLNLMQNRINSILSNPWKNLYVLGDASWPWGDDQQSLDLQYIFKNAVRHFDDQIITGNVKLKKPLITTMHTKEIFPKDIDFDHIATDCLFHNSSMEEVVLASKIFLKPIQLAEFTALSHLGTKAINGIDILQFNSSLYRLSQPSSIIQGPINFQVPPIFGHLTVQGLVNHMPTNNIFLAYPDRMWPPVKIDTLQVDGDLQLFDIDQMSLNFLLQNRVRKSGPGQEIFGHLTFENLVLDKKVFLQSINGISMDNVVQKNSATLQEITGAKTIDGELQLIGPAMIVKLNNIDLIERYRQTIFLDKNYEFDSLSIPNGTFKEKLIVSTPLASKNPLHDLIQNKTYKESFKAHTKTLKNIETNLRTAQHVIDTKALNPKRLVYLDYDFSTLIEWKLRNDSIQEEFIFDNNRYQYCDREQTIVKWSRYHNRISLSKTITNSVTANEYGITVKADNNCKEGYRHVNSLITITNPHFNKRFMLDKLVHSIEIYNAIDWFVMVHGIDLYAGHNEIRFLKIDNHFKTVRDWQLLTDGVGKVSKLFKLSSHTILVVSTVIENYPSITIYNLNTVTQIFDIVQVIDGDFDIIELAQVTPHSYHLFLSCVHCQRIVIFEYDTSVSSSLEDCQMYHIYQIIKLKTRIDRFNIFTLSDGGIYLLVLSDQDIDFYHIYKYQYIQGWKHFTYGYFKNIQNAYPLLKGGISSVDDNLLLLCNRKCTLVKAFYQL
ncbi:uncharacterized protein LOC129916827 [Episyrphus balteatus]|uniref:uncharacterized protein LOC129916827 n=1 Tax=Episyrphus balteatus TaxID=286459 RepID=UPI0024865C16|nr:uncharacterized protein LOC129916827 [Episyrphus balteatus]